MKATLRRYIDFYNRQRPCFAIGYDTPDNYCKRFYRGEIEQKDTYSKRTLTDEPKLVQPCRAAQKRKEMKTMTLSEIELDRYLAQTHQTASAGIRREILDFFTEDPGEGQVWTEQDIWEQVRKLVLQK